MQAWYTDHDNHDREATLLIEGSERECRRQAAEENEEGFHKEPAFCVVGGYGRCYDDEKTAIAVADGELDGSRPDGGDPVEDDYEGGE